MYASQQSTAASRFLYGKSLYLCESDIAAADLPTLKQWLEAAERRLKRERNKGTLQHWSYDLNRHLALKGLRDSIRDRISAVRT